MKRVFVSLLVSSLALGAMAQETAKVLPWNGTTVAMVCDQINHHLQTRPGRIQPNVVSLDGSEFAFIIPVAGNIPGAGGTFFHSDLSIANNRSTTQVISIAFLRRNVNSGSDGVTTMSLPPQSVTNIDDFVAAKLNKQDLGALLIAGQKADGSVDGDAMLDGFSRIWTPQPGSSGTVSQSLPAVPIQDVLLDSYALGLKQDSRFRTNVGAVNTSANTRTFNVTINGSAGSSTMTLTTPPYSMNQTGIPAGVFGNLTLVIGTPASDTDWWSAYGTTVDNVTGDGWVSHVH